MCSTFSHQFVRAVLTKTIDTRVEIDLKHFQVLKTGHLLIGHGIPWNGHVTSHM